MPQLEILSPHSPVDISPFSERLPGPSWSAQSVVQELLSKSPSTRIVSDDGHMADEAIFPSLPPLRNGHPEVQLRDGIMRASRLALANEPDAEKAFFVADLSQVYMQHERWKKCLPEIEPHSGE